MRTAMKENLPTLWEVEVTVSVTEGVCPCFNKHELQVELLEAVQVKKIAVKTILIVFE